MKFLVTGSTGLVGSQVVKDLVEQGDTVYSSFHDTKPEHGIPIHMDLNHLDEIENNIQKIKPDAIIHLAALTNVDLCEKEKEKAIKINSTATEIISKQAAKQKSFLVYVSTDYVFDGTKGMRKESDMTNPVDFYGKSKLDGEKKIMNLASSWCIARTSTPYGLHQKKKSFPYFVAENLQNNNEIKAIVDQFTSPTYVGNLSKMLIEISKRQIVGLLHVAGATRISRYEVAELVAKKLNFSKNLLKPINIKDMNWIAKRPKDSSLDVSLASEILKEKPLNIEKGLDNFLRELKPQLSK